MPYSGTKIAALYDDNGNGLVIHGVQLADVSFADKKTSNNDVNVKVFAADSRFYASIAKKSSGQDEEIASRRILTEKSLKKLSKKLHKHFKGIDLPESLRKLGALKKTSL